MKNIRLPAKLERFMTWLVVDQDHRVIASVGDDREMAEYIRDAINAFSPRRAPGAEKQREQAVGQ